MSRRREDPADGALGAGETITRRDFVGSTLIASGALLLGPASPARLWVGRDDFTGFGGVSDYAGSNGNTLEVMTAGHTIREGRYASLPSDTVETGEHYDCVVVGGGISGLAAGVSFLRRAGRGRSCLVLDDHPIFGGEAKRNEFLVDGERLLAHQGSAVHFVQPKGSAIERFYGSIGFDSPKLEYQRWAGPDPEKPLSRTPYDAVGLARGEYGFYFDATLAPEGGVWVLDPLGSRLRGAPVDEATRSELYRWFSGSPAAGSRFERPRSEGDAVCRRLDSITLEQHIMERFGLRRETVRRFLAPFAGGGSGLGPDALSAYADYAADFLHPVEGEGAQMFPGGNAGIARLIAKALIPESIRGPATVQGVCRGSVDFGALDRPGAPARLRLGATVVHVTHEGVPEGAGSVSVAYLREGRVHRIRARSAVMAGGCWTTRAVVRDLPPTLRDAYSRFHRSPCLMINVAVRNWRFLYDLGLTGCRWFGAGLGSYMEVRKLATCGPVPATIGPDSPIVLTLKVLFPSPGLPTREQGIRGRLELFQTPFREYERRIRRQLHEMFSRSGFDARRHIAGIILNRWGHAYLSPEPGFFFGRDDQPAPRELLRRAPFGRIAFANTDLAGAMDHRYSILEAERAVGQILGLARGD